LIKTTPNRELILLELFAFGFLGDRYAVIIPLNLVNLVESHFFFDFFPPDFLESPPPLLDFLFDFLLEDFLSLLTFLSEDMWSFCFLSDPFLPFFAFSGSPPPPDGAPPPPPPEDGGGGGLEMVIVSTWRPW